MSEPEFDDQPYRGTQILWGRVIVLLLALALAFWLGTTFGGDASAQAELERRRTQISQLESEVAALEAQVAAVDAGGADTAEQASPDDDDDEAAGAGDQADDQAADGDEDGTRETDTEADRQYVVQSGDSLAAIAQEVYGDPTLWQEIARANNLSQPYSLTVGDTLEIPPQP